LFIGKSLILLEMIAVLSFLFWKKTDDVSGKRQMMFLGKDRWCFWEKTDDVSVNDRCAFILGKDR